MVVVLQRPQPHAPPAESERQYIVQGEAQREGEAAASPLNSLGYLLKQHKVRKTLIVNGMLLGLAVAGAATSNHANLAIMWISITLGGPAFMAPISWNIPALIAPRGTVGTVGSIMNFLNNIMVIATPIVTGFIAGGTGSFALGFLVAAIVLVIGILCYVFLLGRIEPIPEPAAEAGGTTTAAAA